MIRPAALAALAGILAGPAAAQAPADRDPAWSACRNAISAAERRSGIPSGLLGAIALIESARRDPVSGRLEPWPWSYNAAGDSRAPATRAEAVAEVSALLESGVRSIDVGCMQVNLQHHPQAFASLEQAFEPEANVRYAVRFLQDLRARTGSWAEAVAQYHSADPGRGLGYQSRVVATRRGAAAGPGGLVMLPRNAAGLCAPGLRPALRPRAARAAATARSRVVCLRPGRSRPD